MTTPAFWFIRHGETDWNVEGRLQGQRDIPLNGKGRAQADAVGHRMAALLRAGGIEPSAARFVVSPLGRTRETAERARAAMGVPVADYRLDDRLAELTFGAWEGLTWPDVKALDLPAYRARRGDKWGFVPPGGESYAQLGERLRPWLTSLTEDMVVVAHGGVARALFVLIGGAAPAEAVDMDVHQGRVLRFAEGEFSWR